MSFNKAIQNKNPEEYERYVAALMEYKAECSAFKRATKLWKLSLIRDERLRYFEAHERFRLACKVFQKSREHYARMQAISAIKERGIDNISAVTLAQVAGIEVAMSMRAMMAKTEQDKAIARVEADPRMKELYEQLMRQGNETAEIVEKEPTSTKAKFVTGIKEDPFNGDFEF